MNVRHTFRPSRTAGRVIAVVGTKGGCGATTVATNLALALQAAGQTVCLVDLDIVAGDAGAVLGLEPTRTLADWDLDDQDAARNVARVVTPWAPGLDCVLAPVSPGVGVRMPVPVVEGALNTLAQHYDAVVIDIPARTSPYSVRALECSHEHVLVTTPERPSLRRLRQELDVMDLLGFDPSLRTVVFNRSDRWTPDGAVARERSSDFRLTVHVPASADVADSINRGVPLVVASPEHPVSVAITELAELLLPEVATAPVVPLTVRLVAPQGLPTSGRGP
jgi:pilus assembly protein CpaE